MNNRPSEPVSDPVTRSAEAVAPVRRRYLSRKACLAIIFVAAPALLWLEFAKPTLTEDPVLAPLITMTLTRLIGAAVFLALLLNEGYRVLNPFQKPFLKSLLFALPPFLVVVNNMPILSMIWGDAYLVHKAPVYLIWFAAECLAIGLFVGIGVRFVPFGFFLMTFALVLGALWGKICWGDWWQYDPKEMWSLATWLTFAAYFHFRRNAVASRWLLRFGAVMIILTLTWVNFSRIFKGLHSYV